MILLFRGADDVAMGRRLAQLRAEADAGNGMGATNVNVLDGREARTDDILGPALTPPFLAPQRVVIAEGFLDRFVYRAPRGSGGDETPAATATSRQSRALDAFEPLIAQLTSGLPPTTVLVLTGKDAGRNTFVERLNGVPGVAEETFAPPARDNLLRYIREEASVRGIRFKTSGAAAAAAHNDSAEWLRSRQADPVGLLATLTQGDTMRIASELDKLALYSLGRETTVDAVYEMCSGEREFTNFNFIDALFDRKTLEALDILPAVMREMESGQALLGFLLARYQQMAVVTELLERGAAPEEVDAAIGGAARYRRLRENRLRRARRLGQAGARAAIRAIADADRSIKSGIAKEDLAIYTLVLRLTQK